MYDVIIVGKGPAGISAALYTCRGKLETLIIGGESYLVKSHKIDNYYGFPNGIDGRELLKMGEEQARNLGVDITDDTVVSIDYDEKKFKVVTKENTYEARAVLMATGQAINKVKIENIDKFEGKGIHYCVICDGFFYNGKKCGILGYTDYAVHETMELFNFSKDVTIFTNGKELEISEANKAKLELHGVKVDKNKISKFEGENALGNITFEDGKKENIDGLFVAYGSASSADFARKLGVFTEKNAIKVDVNQKTNVPGLFAAGDCTGGFKQVAVAVGQGAIAGQRMVEYIRDLGK